VAAFCERNEQSDIGLLWLVEGRLMWHDVDGCKWCAYLVDVILEMEQPLVK